MTSCSSKSHLAASDRRPTRPAGSWLRIARSQFGCGGGAVKYGNGASSDATRGFQMCERGRRTPTIGQRRGGMRNALPRTHARAFGWSMPNHRSIDRASERKPADTPGMSAGCSCGLVIMSTSVESSDGGCSTPLEKPTVMSLTHVLRCCTVATGGGGYFFRLLRGCVRSENLSAVSGQPSAISQNGKRL